MLNNILREKERHDSNKTLRNAAFPNGEYVLRPPAGKSVPYWDRISRLFQ